MTIARSNSEPQMPNFEKIIPFSSTYFAPTVYNVVFFIDRRRRRRVVVVVEFMDGFETKRRRVLTVV